MPGKKLKKKRIRPPFPIPLPPPGPSPLTPEAVNLHNWFARYGIKATEYAAELAKHPGVHPKGKFADLLAELVSRNL